MMMRICNFNTRKAITCQVSLIPLKMTRINFVSNINFYLYLSDLFLNKAKFHRTNDDVNITSYSS